MRGRRWLWRQRIWPWLLWRPPSFPSWKSAASAVAFVRLSRSESAASRSVADTPPPRQLWRRRSSPPMPSQSHLWHSQTSNSCVYEAIWNVKTKSEVLTIFQNTVWNDFFSYYQSETFFSYCQSEMFFSDCQSEMNLKQSKIWRQNLKLFVPIWNQYKTSLKPIWKCTNTKYNHIGNLK